MDGNVFITSPFFENIRYVSPEGIIHTVLSGPESSFGSGGPVRAASGFAVDRDHNIYVTRGTVNVIHPDGSQGRVTGNGSTFGGDGGPAQGLWTTWFPRFTIDT